jgi:hypothetical protein
MALFSIKTGFATISCLAVAFATAACSSGSDDNDTGPVTGTGGSVGGGAPTAGDTAGGVGGAGGAVAPLTVLYSFASAEDCAAWTYGNASPAPAYDISAQSTITCDSADGQPEPPSLKIVAPFSQYLQPDDQRVDLQFAVPDAPLDMTGKVISVWIKLDSGFVGPDSSSPGGIVIYAKSGANYDWGQAPWHNLINPDNAQKWIKYSFDLSKPDPGSTATFDPSQILSIGIMIDTGNPGAPLVPPSTGTFHIDTIGYQ